MLVLNTGKGIIMDSDTIININSTSNSDKLFEQTSNPITSESDLMSDEFKNYNQTIPRPKYDKDTAQIIEIVRILNNMAPLTMPEYNFNIDEINGERFYNQNGSLTMIRDFDSDVIRDYYYNPDYTDIKYSVAKILEHDKNTGRLRVKIEPITRPGSRLKTNIAIFDEKINKKYTIIQLSDGGIVNNISEFSGKGESFQTLFRNIYTFKPVRYLEGKDSETDGFEMIDCLFAPDGKITKIKRYNNKREICIDYTETQKHITVKNK